MRRGQFLHPEERLGHQDISTNPVLELMVYLDAANDLYCFCHDNCCNCFTLVLKDTEFSFGNVIAVN